MQTWSYHTDLTGLDSIDDIIQVLLASRGLTDSSQLTSYFTPKHPKDWDWSDYGISPDQINQLQNLLSQHRTDPILIYGDYDVDGLCATTILTQTLQQQGYHIIPYIPSRSQDGYGLNLKTIQRLHQQFNFTTVITIDNGITAHPAIDWLNQHHLATIIIDHHQTDQPPSADLIINNTDICGSALAWGIARQLTDQAAFLEPQLQLTAMATVCDVMPLTQLNRALVWHGLRAIKHQPHPAITTLCQVADLDPLDIDAYHFGFVLGPRLNAAGRLDDVTPAFELLTTDQPSLRQQYVHTLDQLNQQRQLITEAGIQSALQHIDHQQPLISLYLPELEEGIIGLVAGKLTQKYYRPSIVATQSGEVIKASCRSIKTIDITQLLKAAYPDFTSVGGHSQAAGFSLPSTNWDTFQTHISDYANQHIQPDDLIPQYQADGQLQLDQISLSLINAINLLQPFGMGNPKPIFISHSIKPTTVKIIGKQATHLKLTIPTAQGNLDALAWNAADRLSEIKQSAQLNIAYTLDINTWNGNSKPQLHLKDFWATNQ